MIRTIFIPVDFSEAAARACEYGVDLAEKLNTASGEGTPAPTVEIFHCYEIPAMTGPDGSLLVGPETATDIMDDAQKRLKAFAKRFEKSAVTVQHRTSQGPAADTILGRAKEIGADLIIMGTHGRKGLKRFFLGSVAEQVLRSATIPVLTMRPEDAGDDG